MFNRNFLQQKVIFFNQSNIGFTKIKIHFRYLGTRIRIPRIA